MTSERVVGKVVGGKVVVDVPADWPEGAEVRVEPIDPEAELPDDEDVSPEAIARRLALMAQIEPFLTPDEEAAWLQARAEYKAWAVAQADARDRKLREAFE